MRPLPPRRPGRWFLVMAAVFSAVVLSSCGDEPNRQRVRSIQLGAPAPVLRPGSTMSLLALTFGADGEPVEATTIWQSLTPAIASVDATGLMLAKAPGMAKIRASVGHVSADIEIELRNPPATTLELSLDSLELFLPSGALTLGVTVADSDGVAIIGAPLLWESSATRLVTVSTQGEVSAKAAGLAYVVVDLAGRRDSAIVVVSATGGATAPTISSVTPSTIVPGQSVLIEGTGFSFGPSTNTVLVNGFAMTVDSAARSRIYARLTEPVPCLPTSSVSLQVASAGGIGVAPVTLQAAPQRTLGVGDAFVPTTAASAACNEIVLADGEYLLTLSNTARALGSGTLVLRMAGRIAPGATSSSVVAADARAPSILTTPGMLRAADPIRGRQWRAHQRLLEDSRDAIRGARTGSVPPRAELQVPPVNGLVNVRIANLDLPGFCNAFTSVGARTVYSGPHIAVLEDTTSRLDGQQLLTGQLDSVITTLAAEIESVMWPIATRFGDPLVMDDRLDDNGQVVVLLTPRMNTMRGGDLIAATLTCDFFSRSFFSASNVGEMIYLQVPTSSVPGLGAGTLERWQFDIRSAIVHELKHVTSFAERIVRSQPLEEIWLEEATARHAEELYARAIYGLAPKSDADFANTVRCEVREFGPPARCDNVPRMMRNHLDGLWDFLAAPESHSPLGATAPGDASFYGSAWALTRWAIDQSTMEEGTILNGLTLSGQAGVANLEARVGLPWEVLVPLWSLAMLTDGTADSASSPQLAFPSWKLADLYSGLCDALGPCALGTTNNNRYGRAHPARPIARPVGEFALTTAPIQPGGFVALRLTGTVSSGRQLIDLSGATGALPSTVRLAILRVN